MGRSVQKTVRIFARIDGARFELKWPPMSQPSGKRWAQFLLQIFAHVKISHAGAATKPLKHAAYGKIGTKFAHIERHRAGRLKNIQNYMGPNAVSFLDDGIGDDKE